jgi:hypothetical protein
MRKEPRDIRTDVELQKQRSIHRLGGGHPVCCICGEDDPRTLERHHVAGRVNDDLTVIICGNCHEKQPSSQSNAKNPVDPPIMERVGHLLIGLADFLVGLIEALRRFGESLINGAAHCPSPWGWLPAVEG